MARRGSLTDVLQWPGPSVALVCSLVLLSCSSSPLHGAPVAPPPSDSGTSGLVQAQFPDCGAQGNDLAIYLGTGRPTSDDPTYGDQRQVVLSLSGEHRALYIRQQADALIEKCDEGETSAIQQQQAQQQAAAQQAAQQAAAAAAAAAQAAELARAEPACKGAAGQVGWDGGNLVCRLQYLGTDGATYAAEASMNANTGQLEGPLNTGGTGATQQECASGYYPDLSSGPGYGPKGTWNSALQACIPR